MSISDFPRPDWDTYFMRIAHVVKERGNCLRRKVAAVIVKDRRLISTGYNGTPRGVRNCFEGGCERCASDAPSGSGLGECICSHAEENSITQAAYHGISVRDGTIYCTLSPCLMCAKMIINAGIAEVVYDEEYHFGRQTRNLFDAAGVRCRRLPISGDSVTNQPPSGKRTTSLKCAPIQPGDGGSSRRSGAQADPPPSRAEVEHKQKQK